MNEKLSLKIPIRENLRESCFENEFSPAKMQYYQGFSDRVGRNYLFDRYKIREKYFKIVAKNKYIYYLLKFILSITFVAIGIIAYIVNQLSLYYIAILYMCLYFALYDRRKVADWEIVKEIYIDKYDEIEKIIEKNNKRRF